MFAIRAMVRRNFLSMTAVVCLGTIMGNKTTSKWIDLAVKPNFSWPNKQIEIEFEKRLVI